MDTRPCNASDLLVWCCSLLLAAGLLLFASKSSPLFPLNDWVDANTLLTVGKSLMQGQVLYRDVFDHKGPYIYLAYGLGWLVSHQGTTGGFTGVWVLEVLGFTVFLRCAWHTVALYGGTVWATLGLPLLAVLVLHSASFTHGGSAEELVLPLMAVSLLGLARVHQQGVLPVCTARFFLLNGMCAGLAFFTKYSWMGFWLGGAMVVAGLLVQQRAWARLGAGLCWAALGVVLVLLPWLLYFGAHGAMHAFIEAYFSINLGAYADKEQRTAGVVLANMATSMRQNPALAALMLMGVLGLLWVPGHARGAWQRLVFVLPCAGLLLSVYGGGKTYVYYFFVFSVFAPLGLAVMGWSLQRRIQLSQRMAWVGACVLAAMGVVGTALWHPNAALRQVRAQDMVQYRFAALVRQAQDQTVLNYLGLDMGLHTVLGTVPSVRFFVLNNIDHQANPLLLDTQRRYVRDAVTEFVVVRGLAGMSEADLAGTGLLARYQRVATQDQVFENIPFTYMLFQRKVPPGLSPAPTAGR